MGTQVKQVEFFIRTNSFWIWLRNPHGTLDRVSKRHTNGWRTAWDRTYSAELGMITSTLERAGECVFCSNNNGRKDAKVSGKTPSAGSRHGVFFQVRVLEKFRKQSWGTVLVSAKQTKFYQNDPYLCSCGRGGWGWGFANRSYDAVSPSRFSPVVDHTTGRNILFRW